MCTYVLCTRSPSPHPCVCVWAIPAPPPTCSAGGRGPKVTSEGTGEGGNRRGREPGVLIQTHRGARGGHEVTCHLHHTQTPAPSLAAAVATATRGARSIPGYCRPLPLPLCCWGPGCPRGREKCRDCPCHGDPPQVCRLLSRQSPSTTRGLGSTTGASMFQFGVTAAPCNGIHLCVGALLGAGGTTVQPHSELTSHHHCPPDLGKGQGHKRLLSSVQHGPHRHITLPLAWF